METVTAVTSLKGENKMYKAQIEKSVIGENIGLTVVRECGEDSTRYALIRMGIFGKSSYAVCVLGDEYALETLGEDGESAEEMFDMLVRNSVSPIQVYEVVSDLRRERENEIL